VFQTSLYCHLWLTDDTSGFTVRQAELEGADLLLLGPTPVAARDQLSRYAELGVSHAAVKPYDLDTIEIFAAEVAPALVG
jgi:hypothetical protein